MSIQTTVAYGPGFHLYQEAFDDDYLYLELDDIPFEACNNRITVSIPVHIWEVIRQYTGIDLSLTEKTDDEIRTKVEQLVDDRLARKTVEGNSLLGSLVYGPVDAPRDEQIACGVVYFSDLREHQRQVRSAIDELRKTQTPVSS